MYDDSDNEMFNWSDREDMDDENTSEVLHEDGDMTDVEADADTLASAGMGTDEDYGYYGEEC